MVTAIIAGNGYLPKVLVKSLQDQKKHFVCITYIGQTDPFFIELLKKENVPFLETFPGYISKQIDFMKLHNVKNIVMGGGLKRPGLKDIKVDSLGAKWLFKLGKNFLGGDDQLLQSLILLLEKEGFHVLSATDISPKLIHQVGVLTDISPADDEREDVFKGLEILRALSQFDIGQSLIIQNGRVIGIEAAEGTANLILRCAKLKLEPQGGILVKMSKFAQTPKADLPSLGIETIEQAHLAGLHGIAFEANKTQLIQPDQMIELANRYKIFLLCFE